MVFSKSYCPYCQRAKATLQGYNSPMKVIELDQAPYNAKMDEYQDYLSKLTGARSVPRVFIGGKSLGGNDDTQRAHNSGKLQQMISALK